MQPLIPGTPIKPQRWHDIYGRDSLLPTPRRWTHLQFRRYSGCVMCNLHLQQFISRQQELEAAAIQEIIFFHSAAAYLREQFALSSLAFIADPQQQWYREFGVQQSLASIANPSTWWPALQGLARFGLHLPKRGESVLGLPADFLIDPQGILVAADYGKHAYDQWSLDELLTQVKQEDRAR